MSDGEARDEGGNRAVHALRRGRHADREAHGGETEPRRVCCLSSLPFHCVCRTLPLRLAQLHCAFRVPKFLNMHVHTRTQPQNEGNRVDVTKQLNTPSLIKFLSRAAPLIEYELAAAARSRAFDGYALIEEEAERQVSFIENVRAAGICGASHF